MDWESSYNKAVDLTDRFLPESNKQRKILLISLAAIAILAIILFFIFSGPSKQQKVESLVAKLNDPDRLARELAIDKLKKYPRSLVYRSLVKALPGDFKDKFWGKLGDYSEEINYSYVAKAFLAIAAPLDAVLLEQANSHDQEKRYYSAWVMGLLKDPAAINTLAQLTDDNNKKVSYRAFKSLVMFGQPQASEIIVNILLENKKDKIYLLARSTLCQYERQAYVELFSELATHQDRKTRLALACLLKKQGDKENIAILKKLFKDSSAAVRRAAIEAIYEIDSSQAIPLIKNQGIKDKYWGNRQHYLELLCNDGARYNQATIKKFLKDKKVKVKYIRNRYGRKVRDVSYPVRKTAYDCLVKAGIRPKNVYLGKQVTKFRKKR